MPAAHLIFIPGVLMVGVFLGFIMGARAAKNAAALQAKRDEDRAAAKAAREAKKQNQTT